MGIYYFKKSETFRRNRRVGEKSYLGAKKNLEQTVLEHNRIIAIISATVPRALDSGMHEKIREMFQISQTTLTIGADGDK